MFNQDGHHISTLKIYAPTTWVNGFSLHYLMPDNNPLSKLLSWDFGKGYIMRDLSGVDWDGMFCGALDWRYDLTTGSPSNSVLQSGSTQNILPYRGTVNFDDFEIGSISGQHTSPQFVFETNTETSGTDESNESLKINHYTPTDIYCSQFNYYSPGGPTRDLCTSLSVLKNNGKWACVFTHPSTNFVIVDMETLDIPSDSLARSTSGGLRYRLTKCVQNGPLYSYEVKYFTRDYTPQKVSIRYSGLYEGALSNRVISKAADDEYFIDVKIGMSNIEGATKITVEQWDEGEDLPFLYDVENFRSGYFIANLDREVSTQLTVRAYNANGQTKSNTITIPPLGNVSRKVSMEKKNDIISVSGLPHQSLANGGIEYSINCLSNPLQPTIRDCLYDNAIDVSLLNNGFYAISIYDKGKQLGSLKFVR